MLFLWHDYKISQTLGCIKVLLNMDMGPEIEIETRANMP